MSCLHCASYLVNMKSRLTKAERSRLVGSTAIMADERHATFYAPDGFEWYGGVCCLADAKIKGIEAWQEVQS